MSKSPSFRRPRQRPAEDVELVDLQDSVRAVRDVVAEDVVAVVREREETWKKNSVTIAR